MKCSKVLTGSVLVLTLSLAAGPQQAAAQPIIWQPLTNSPQLRLTSTASGLDLGVEGASTDNGAPVVQWGANGSLDQRWQLVWLGNGYHKIVNVHSGKVLDVSGWSTNNGAQVHQWDWHSGDNQQWKVDVAFTFHGGWVYRFQNRHSGKYLDLPDGSQEWGEKMIQWDWNGGSNQIWGGS
jgi:hypothetical protein